MKLFSVAQIKNWDSYTIQSESIKSIDLMENAAIACSRWFIKNFHKNTSIKIFCGRGNNGGDGLAIARLLSQKKYDVSVFIPEINKPGSADFATNFKRLKKTPVEIIFMEDEQSFPFLSTDDLVIDALFGTGLNKKATGLFLKLIKYINRNPSHVVSIDVPSGIYIDRSSVGNAAIKANYTLTFQNQKLAFLLGENDDFTGKVVLLDIGLSKEFEQKEKSHFEFVEKSSIQKIYTPRNNFSNKGNFGYACLVAGSYGMVGAAVLSAKACLRSGVGKLTCNICKAGYSIVQASIPEAMCKVYGEQFIEGVDNFNSFDVIGIGPGIGKYPSHKKLLKELFSNFK